MLIVTSTNPVACCRVCQIVSRQVHCYYTRTLTDLCWADFQVQLKLHVRRFVCSNAMCTRRTFAERLGEPIKAYAEPRPDAALLGCKRSVSCSEEMLGHSWQNVWGCP
jgi:transposase